MCTHPICGVCTFQTGILKSLDFHFGDILGNLLDQLATQASYQTQDPHFPYKYPHFHHLNGQKLLPYRSFIEIPQNIQTKSIELEDQERVRTRLIFNHPQLENNFLLTSVQTSNWFKLGRTLFKVILVNPNQIVQLILLHTQLWQLISAEGPVKITSLLSVMRRR